MMRIDPTVELPRPLANLYRSMHDRLDGIPASDPFYIPPVNKKKAPYFGYVEVNNNVANYTLEGEFFHRSLDIKRFANRYPVVYGNIKKFPSIKVKHGPDAPSGVSSIYEIHKIVTTGAHSPVLALLVAHNVGALLGNLLKEHITPQNIRIENIVGHISCGFLVDQKKLAESKFFAPIARFTPILIPACIIQLQNVTPAFENIAITCLIFRGGKIIIGGCRSLSELVRVAYWIGDKVQNFRDTVNKTTSSSVYRCQLENKGTREFSKRIANVVKTAKKKKENTRKRKRAKTKPQCAVAKRHKSRE